MFNLRSLSLFSVLFSMMLPSHGATSPGAHIHVIVSLVDNASQGIVPVPAKIGNGDEPHSNLYWGALYGVKTFLSKAGGWRELGCRQGISETILERCEFAWKDRLTLTADAYRGSRIGQAMLDFMQHAATPPDAAAREMTHIACESSLSGILLEERCWTSQHDRISDLAVRLAVLIIVILNLFQDLM